MRFDIPVFGTAAHSWMMAFGDEERSFRALQKLLGESTVFLIDTYDTLDGAHLAVRLGKPFWGVRLDSGNLGELARQVRRILDDAGLRDAKIFATNDLDEYRVAEFVKAGVPLDAFGVGTQLATSADAPALSAVYKMVELKRDGEVFYTAKFSSDKSTLPGAKQIYRYADRDVVAHYSECSNEFKGEPLLRPILTQGELVETLPEMQGVQTRSQAMVAALPRRLRELGRVEPYSVELSPLLRQMAEDVREEMQAAK
jgi:nicotinate phosphoribosyltransferase